jgi:hypothetical protein
MSYIPLASAPSCMHCRQEGAIFLLQRPCGCILPVHMNCQAMLQAYGRCPRCYQIWSNSIASVTTTHTELMYQPNRKWILYSLACFAVLILTCILMWFLYKPF